MFIKKKKEELLTKMPTDETEQASKNNKTLEYTATSKIKEEKVNIRMNLNSSLDFTGETSKEKPPQRL